MTTRRNAPLPLLFFTGVRYKAHMNIARPALMLLLGVALTAQAEVYKCRQPDGRTQISTSPCAGGAKTIKEVEEDVIPDDVRAKAERDAERQRKQANKLEAERKADDAEDRREAERQRKESGLPSPAAVQQCLNTVARMNIDASRRGELESGCQLTGKVAPVYNETDQPPTNYGGGYYYRGHVRPPRPVQPIAPPPGQKPSQPADLYKIPTTPRGSGSR